MKSTTQSIVASGITLGLVAAFAGCGADPGGDFPASGCTAGGSETPPTGDSADILAWLAAGDYLSWACEPAQHDARPGSGHLANRICSNAIASAHTTGKYPAGAASVKELYYDGQTVGGYATALKTGPGGGEAWSWFEQVESGDVIEA